MPFKPEPKPKGVGCVQFNVSMQPDEVDRARRAAKTSGLSLSYFTRLCTFYALDNMDDE